MSVIESIINGYLGVFDWILDNVFFFVTVDILKLFALSFLIMSLMQMFSVNKKWIKWLIGILYGLYCVFKILPIRNLMIHFDIAEVPNVLPYFCMILLPAMVQKTNFGSIFFTYHTISMYYVIINVVWITIDPTAGIFFVTIGFAVIVYLLAQLGGSQK